MASISETGHTRNVANFESLISFCTAYGTVYNPSKNTLTIQNLNNLLSSAKESINQVNNAKNNLDLIINDRQIKFASLKSTTTRIINALSVSGTSKETLSDAKTINKKIQGKRSSPKHQEGSPIKNISTSQLSYDSILNNFLSLLDLIALENRYNPNETELKVQKLQIYSQELQTANTAVINANTDYSNAIIQRNNTLYTNQNAMVTIALDVKNYIKSVFGSTSSQYKQVGKISFRKK